MRIVSIGAVIRQAHVITSGEGQWIVNHRIDLRTFNEIYEVILQDCVFGRMSITWLIGRYLRIGPQTNTRMAEVKPDPAHASTSAGPPLCIIPFPADILSFLFFLLHTSFIRRTFYPSPLNVLPSSAGHLPNLLSLHFADIILRVRLQFGCTSSGVVNYSIE